MKNFLPLRYQIIAAVALCLGNGLLQAQSTFPATGFNLPVGKTIVITYEVDVNANACPTGTLPGANLTNQGTVTGSNFATVLTDDPDIAGSSNPTLTPFSTLTIGNLVYKDVNRDGDFDSGTDLGVNGVLVNLYLDNGDGVLTGADGAAITNTNTAGGGLYSFVVCPGSYIVQLAASNFNPGGALYDNGLSAALISSPVGGAPDPDNDVNNDDNGDPVAGFGVASQAVTVGYGTEPTTDGDADNNTNLSVDFGFKTPTTVSINDVTLTEGTGGSTTAYNFTVTRNDNSEAFNLTVNTNTGTAVSPSDYTAISSGTVSFTAGGSLTQTVTVLVNHDNTVEANETFTVDLSGAPADVTLTDASGLGTINNDDAAVVTLSGGIAQNEGTSFVFTATLDNPVQGGFSVAFTTNNGTATTADLDYTDNDGSLNFTGTAGETKTITVISTADNKVELDEAFTVALGAITGAPSGVTTAGSPQTGTITNDDAATVALAANVNQSEATTPQIFSVTLTNPVDVGVTVTFSTSDGTATTADNDYTGIAGQTVTFAAGTTTAQTANVAIINDTKVEVDEVYNVAIGTLSATGRNVTLGTSTRTGTILNDDAAVVTLTGGGAANEGNTGTSPRVFTATLNNPVQGGFTVPYATNDGTATIANNDYADNDGILTFTGTAGEIKTFTVNVNGDLVVEANETYTATLGAITGAPTGVTTAGSPQTATINNDEVDYGDIFDIGAPFFATTLASNGARHNTVLGFHLGATVDGELDGQPDFTATGDDANGDDEDGVVLPVLVKGTTANISVTASAPGLLNAWVDFEANATWIDSGNQIFTNFPLMAGVNNISFAVPAAASSTTAAFARFRFSSAGGLGENGSAVDGEVEDYMTSIIDNLFSIDNPSVVEGNAGTTNLMYTISRSSNVTASSVDYAITGGTATSGVDHVPLAAGTINFTAGGALTQTITVTVTGDVLVENNETVIITLSNPVGGGLGTNPGTGTITNDDNAVVTLTGGIAQNEGNAGTVTYTFTATLNNAVQGGFTAPYTTGSGTATAGSDYTDNDGNLIFTGTAGEIKTWTVAVNGDVTVELDETFQGALGALSGAPAGVTTAGSPQIATITNDDAATIALAADVTGPEATTPQTFSATLSNPVDVPVTVQFNTTDGTATTADMDYTGIVNQTVTFAANTITAQSVNVTIVNDPKVETNETYTGTISGLAASGRNVSLGTATRTGTITNDDAAVVTLTGGGAANEGNTGTTSRVFTATLNNPVQGGFTLPYTTNDGTATTADNDYVDNDGPALVFAGTASEAKTITILVNGDSKVEANETFTITLGAISGAPSGVTTAGSPQTGTITNDELDWGDGPDSLPTLSFYNGARHATVLGFQLGAAIDGDPDGQGTGGTWGNLANGDDTDADGDDEDGVTLPSVFVRGTTATITVNASQAGKLDAWMDFNWNRQLGDAGEKIFNNVALAAGDNVLTFAVPAGATVGSSFLRFRFSSAGGLSHFGLAADGEVEDYRTNIVNNQFSIDSPSVVEGNAGTSSLTFTITRTTNTNSSSVDYAITGGTATSGSDYVLFAGGTANFTAGGALSQTITVTVNGDLVVEDNETVVMTLSNPVNGGISTGTGTGTITNDDAANLTLSGGIAQNEGNAGTVAYTFAATLSAAVQGGFQIPYTTNDGTATTADNDYADNDLNLTFAGTVGETKTITVLVNGDNKVELNETFTVALGTITNTSAVQAASITKVGSPQTGTITNDDAAVVAIAANVSQSEATTPQAFSVTLTNPVDVGVTVTFSTSDGTATTADNDYTGIAGQTVTFAAGTTTAQTVNVTINNDNKVEAEEVYNVAIGTLAASGRNVSLGTSAGTGTILNDDNAVVTLSGGIAQNEGNSGTTPFVFTATLNNPVQGGFTASYVTNDGTATIANNDYIDNDGLLSFTGTAGETKTFTVLVNGDLSIEADETFQTVITSLSGVVNPPAVTIAGSPQTATITNDEQDWGDAPSAAQSGFANSYPTLANDNGARHGTAPGAIRLGATIDADLDGQPNATATGDGADEDGVTLPSAIVINTNANITVNASAAGVLNAWVDFSRDGDWNDAGEQIFTNQAVVAGNNALSFAVPGTSALGGSFARFRVSTASGTSFDGAAADGEVEDYTVNIVNTQFTINDPTVNEGNAGTTNLAFTVTRTVNVNACSVDYAITGGTATTGDNDYQVLAAGTINFTAGGSFTAPINVVVNGDVKVELNETVDMTLSNPVNASILDGSGTGTIVNDDAAVITMTNASVIEGDVGTSTPLTFTINMSNPSDANVVVNYNTLDGSATIANNDYQTTSGALTFTPGQQSKIVMVTINGDCNIEPNETLLLRLGALVNNGRNITLSGGGATLDGTGTISNDDALPVIACPASFSRNVDPGVCTTSVTLPLPTISSLCGTSVLEFHYRTVDANNNPTGPYNAFVASGSNTVIFTRGKYEIEWRVTDGSGSSVCSYYLTVIDNQAPLIVCPANQTLAANNNCSAPVGTWLPVSLSDNCTPNGLLIVSQSPGASHIITGHNSTVLVTLGAKDESGNGAVCSFSITLKDVTPPVVLCKNATVNIGSNGTVIVQPGSIDNGSSDNCSFSLTLTPNTFTCVNIGLNLVTLRATDAGGNTATCTASVLVQDITPPMAICANPTIFLDNTGNAFLTPAQMDNGSSDNCSSFTRSISRTDFNCSELQGSTWPVTLTLKDARGNTSSCIGYVTVKDIIPPTAVCQDVTVKLGSNGRAIVFGANLAAGSTDNCAVWSYSPIAKVYGSGNLGVNFLTITVRDYSNNSSTCVSQVTVLPFSAPSDLGNGTDDREALNDFSSDEGIFDIVVYPNPTTGDATLAFELPTDQSFMVRVFDLSGRMIYNRQSDGWAGENFQPISLNGIASGVYIVDFQSEGLKVQKRLVVQHN